MKRPAKPTDEERQRRCEATRLLTLHYLALKESRRDVMDMMVEEHAESIMEEVQQRLERLTSPHKEGTPPSVPADRTTEGVAMQENVASNSKNDC